MFTSASDLYGNLNLAHLGPIHVFEKKSWEMFNATTDVRVHRDIVTRS